MLFFRYATSLLYGGELPACHLIHERAAMFSCISFPFIYLKILYAALKPSADSIFSFFKTLIDHEVTVELKNDIQIRGTLKSVDQYLNIKLDDISVIEELKYPHLVCVPATPPFVGLLT